MILKLVNASSSPVVKLNDVKSIPVIDQGLRVIGWGKLDVEDDDVPDILQEVDVTYQTNKKCNRGSYEGYVTKEMICAKGYNLTGSCRGDSGGPLIIPGNSNSEFDVQVGVVSWGRTECIHRKFNNLGDICIYQRSPFLCITNFLLNSSLWGRICSCL
jgi:secreted trypsin-like serine protease